MKKLGFQIVFPVAVMMMVIVAGIVVIVPRLVQDNVERNSVDSAIKTLRQIKVLRAYYTDNVVKKIQEQGALTPAFDHHNAPDKIPLPATMVHDLSEAVKKAGVEFRLYSAYPFPNRQQRRLDSFQVRAWNDLQKDPEQVVKTIAEAADQTILRVAIADLMQVQACVDCHNAHPLSPKADWKLGDVRGVLEVAVDISEQLKLAGELSIWIVAGVGTSGLVLIFVFLVLTRRITGPIGEITEIMNRLVHGDFSVEIPSRIRTLEIRDMAESVNLFKNALREQRRLEDQEMAYQAEKLAAELKFRSVAELAGDAIILADNQGKITFWNGAASKIFGYDSTEAIGSSLTRIMPERYRAFHQAALSKVSANGKSSNTGTLLELSGLRHDGTEFPIELTLSMWQQDEEIYYCGILRDITLRKKTEQEMDRAKEEAETANRIKTDFLANMSHELRTPLNAIIGFSEMIKEAMFGSLDRQYQEYANDINQSGEHLLNLISDILDISIVEAGGLTIEEEEVNLVEAVAACDSMVRGRVEEAGVSLTFDIPADLPKLYVDPIRLKQILLNLVGNAIKFTPQAGRITVNCGIRDDGGLALVIADTGIGIHDEDIPKVLERFGQVRDGHMHTHEGTGLGLALTKMLMELHGGTLEIESEVGKGTKVTIAFPPERIRIRSGPLEISHSATGSYIFPAEKN